MIVRLVLAAVFLAAGLRSGVQGWNSYRHRRVRVSTSSRQSIDRQAQPLLYWASMAVHMLLVATFVGIAVALMLGSASHHAGTRPPGSD